MLPESLAGSLPKFLLQYQLDISVSFLLEFVPGLLFSFPGVFLGYYLKVLVKFYLRFLSKFLPELFFRRFLSVLLPESHSEFFCMYIVLSPQIFLQGFSLFIVGFLMREIIFHGTPRILPKGFPCIVAGVS